LERERLEKVRLDKERLEKERLEKERPENERLVSIEELEKRIERRIEKVVKEKLEIKIFEKETSTKNLFIRDLSDSDSENVENPETNRSHFWKNMIKAIEAKKKTEEMSNRKSVENKSSKVIGAFRNIMVSKYHELPDIVQSHYCQYSLKSKHWELVGTKPSPSYLKLIKITSQNYKQLVILWSLLDGERLIISEAYAVYNPTQLNMFNSKYLNLVNQFSTNPKLFMSDNWKNKDPDGSRLFTKMNYDNWATTFEWNKDLMVSIVPVVHGTDFKDALSIISTGFVALSNFDPGYYGKGLYFSSSLFYTLPYLNIKKTPAVLISFVLPGNIYPVIEHPNGVDSLLGSAIIPGYNSHYVLTRRNGFPINSSLKPWEKFYSELVIEQESSVLPFYLVKVNFPNFTQLSDCQNDPDGTKIIPPDKKK